MEENMKVAMILVFSIVFVQCIGFGEKFNVEKKKFYVTLEQENFIRKEPGENSSILKVMPIREYIDLITETNIYFIVKQKTYQWVFVDTRNYDSNGKDTIKGWIPSYYIGDLSDFDRLKQFKKYSIAGADGDYLIEYNFFENGTYAQRHFDEQGKFKSVRKGKVYRYRNIILASDDRRRLELFYINKEGQLCYGSGWDGRLICSKEFYTNLYYQ
jgi:hypothetical protein